MRVGLLFLKPVRGYESDASANIICQIHWYKADLQYKDWPSQLHRSSGSLVCLYKGALACVVLCACKHVRMQACTHACEHAGVYLHLSECMFVSAIK